MTTGEPVGAVLAGGRSSRFGAPKALAELGGRTLLERALESVAAAGLEPVVVARQDSPLPVSSSGVRFSWKVLIRL